MTEKSIYDFQNDIVTSKGIYPLATPNKPDYDCYAKAKIEYQEAMGELIEELRNLTVKPEYQPVLNKAIEAMENLSEAVRLRVL